ncbi:helix-turn-helix domain-containing protein [Nocardioides plantarum]|uniref:Helix-turn-helix domain-containing protein n=1 Tax=Nocardioides plantarum TaxID=29299 RepID=A0ABV5KCP9_9ACTN|nr:helix-turn-helix domain-containing protein [Nocardioides plantarum]
MTMVREAEGLTTSRATDRSRHLRPSAHAGRPTHLALVPHGRRTRARSQIVWAVTGSVGAHRDVAHDLVDEAIEAFLDQDGDPVRAFERMAPRAWEFGELQARSGAVAADLERGFRAARAASLQAVARAFAEVSGHDRIRLQQAVALYVQRLLDHIAAAHQQMSRLVGLDARERSAWLADVLFGARPASLLPALADLVAGDSASGEERRLVAVVSLGEPIPAAQLSDPAVLRHRSRHEVLVPDTWTHEELASFLTGPAVVGPPTTLLDAPGGLALARRAAVMLRDTAVDPSRRVIPATDHLGDLLVRGNRLLTDLLVHKHLAPLEQISGVRRLNLAEITLLSLESGLPINQLAREMGVPAQTAHSRMRAARELLGDRLDDPSQRLELIVALRAVLPGWR